MPTTTRRIAALTTALALLLTGCSSGDEDAAPEPSATTSQAQPEPTEDATTAPPTEEPSSDIGPLSEKEADRARDMLGAVEYAEGVDEATCDAMFGDREDSVMNLMLNGNDVTNPQEALEVLSTTSAKIDEYAATAPAEVRGHLESLSDTLTRSASAQDIADAQQAAADTETTVNAIAGYCFDF